MIFALQIVGCTSWGYDVDHGVFGQRDKQATFEARFKKEIQIREAKHQFGNKLAAEAKT